jgi:hypothetical protein
MRRLALLLFCLPIFTGCHAANSHPVDPARRQSVDAMNAAEAEAQRQTNNW